jgi:hypothetical protein
MYTNNKNKYILNKVLFDHYQANFPFKEDYCFLTITFTDYAFDFDKQLCEMERLMHSFPFCFIAAREFCLEKAGGWHFHMITHKQNLPLIGKLCEYHMEPPKWDDSFEKALVYLTKESVNECTELDFSRSSKSYYQKNDAKTVFYKVIHRDNKIKLISVPKQIELTPPAPILVPQQIELTSLATNPEHALSTIENGSGTIYWGRQFRQFKRFFWQLFIIINKTFFSGKDDNQRENTSYSGWGNNSP